MTAEDHAIDGLPVACTLSWLGPPPAATVHALPVCVPKPRDEDRESGPCELTLGPLLREVCEIQVSCSARTIEVLVAHDLSQGAAFSYRTTLRGEDAGGSQSQCSSENLVDTNRKTYMHRLQQKLSAGASVRLRMLSLAQKESVYIEDVKTIPSSDGTLAGSGGEQSNADPNSVVELLKNIHSGESNKDVNDPRQALFRSIARGVLERHARSDPVPGRPGDEGGTSRTLSFESAVLSALQRQEKAIERLVKAIERIESLLLEKTNDSR
jgi:hypothetical protein